MRALPWRLPAAALLVAVVLLPPAGRATQRLGESPHGQPDRCVACHLATESGERGPARPVLETCRSCHPDADMHPVGMRPQKVAVREGWPLEDGVVTCATCHAEPGCDAGRDATRPWLRDGTPERLADFCYRCHAADAMQRQSPHLAPGAVDPAEAGCPACHAARPDPGAAVADAKLRASAQEVCATCHPGEVHAGTAEHLGRRFTGTLAPEVARDLPLARGVLGCWTCHDVHAVPRAGAAPSRLAAALSSSTRDARPEALLALPAADGTLCRACHGDGP